jgi:hypothetical protein
MSKSSTTTAKGGLLRNPHPGEILLEEFLKPMGLSQNGLARAVRRINEIVLESAISPPILTWSSHAVLACRKDSFLGCRWTMI